MGGNKLMGKVSCVIPTMKGREAMLAKLVSTIPTEHEIIVVDDEDLLLAAKRNKGAKQAKGEYLVFIDDDNCLKECDLNYLIQRLETDETLFEIGVFGFVACYDDKKELVADGGSKRNYLTGFTRGKNTNARIEMLSGIYCVDEVANAFMIPRALFEEVGGFDEENFPIDLDEADICKRIKNLGYSIVMVPQVIVYHHSQTYDGIADFRRPLNAYTMGRNKVFFQRKHLDFFSYSIYLICFLWLTIIAYSFCLLWRRRPKMLACFLWGIFDGITKSLMSSLPKSIFSK